MSEQERANVAAALAAWRAELRAGSAQTAGFVLNPVWFLLLDHGNDSVLCRSRHKSEFLPSSLLDETGVDTPVTSIYARVLGNSAPSVAVGQTLEAADHPRRWRQMGRAANASRFGEIVAMTVPVATPTADVPGANPEGFAWSS